MKVVKTWYMIVSPHLQRGQDDIRNVNHLAFSQIPSKRLKQTQEHSYN